MLIIKISTFILPEQPVILQQDDHEAVLDLYFTAATEAFRVLRDEGIYIISVKTKYAPTDKGSRMSRSSMS